MTYVVNAQGLDSMAGVNLASASSQRRNVGGSGCVSGPTKRRASTSSQRELHGDMDEMEKEMLLNEISILQKENEKLRNDYKKLMRLIKKHGR